MLSQPKVNVMHKYDEYLTGRARLLRRGAYKPIGSFPIDPRHYTPADPVKRAEVITGKPLKKKEKK
jgi:hypothetical protein